jgi:hypothetical protein
LRYRAGLSTMGGSGPWIDVRVGVKRALVSTEGVREHLRLSSKTLSRPLATSR